MNERRERRATALHEAGHAVVAVALRMRVRKVTIRPRIKRYACEVHRSCVHVDVTSGCVTFGPSYSRSFRRVVEDVIVDYAGELAEGSASGSGDDREDARALARFYSFADVGAERALLSYCRAVARTLVKKHRRAIRCVARELLRKETIDGAEVRRIFRRTRR